MFTKSLLLGSAAALVAVSGARAADAVIIPEPEAVEYVRVCDAAGTGYFYIPGTETCLKVSGYARFQMNITSTSKAAGAGSMGNDANSSPLGGSAYSNVWTPTGAATNTLVLATADDQVAGTTVSSANFAPSGEVKFESWTDSALGPITTMVDLAIGNTGVTTDNVWLSFAGLKMGLFGSFLDNGINGETDTNYLNNKFASIAYSGSAGAISFGVAVDQLGSTVWNNGPGIVAGVEGFVGFTSGAFGATVTGYYDIGNSVGGVVVRASADIGPGALQGRFTWNGNAGMAAANGYMSTGGMALDDGDNGYANWTAEASYAAKLGEKLTLTPGFSWTRYYDNVGANAPDRKYQVGLTADYALTETLAIKASAQYWNYRDGFRGGTPEDANGWNGFLRFQASF